MPLPASGPLSGSQIASEFIVSSNNISIGGLADSASFAPPDAYSDFYGYPPLTFTSIQTSKTVSSSTSTACAQRVNFGRFTSGNPSSVQIGDFMAANSNGTGTIPSGWIKYTSGLFNISFFINSSTPAEVTSIAACSSPPQNFQIFIGSNTTFRDTSSKGGACGASGKTMSLSLYFDKGTSKNTLPGNGDVIYSDSKGEKPYVWTNYLGIMSEVNRGIAERAIIMDSKSAGKISLTTLCTI
tara:strand:- start:222 stop:944 length:723 start_codon:yes stop_codon:yes gene_type:complete